MKYVREKRVTVGEGYAEVDIFARDTAQDEPIRRGSRKRKHKVTSPKQANLNEKNAKRYIVQLANGNFTEDDLFVTLTYNDKHLPKTIEEAEHHVTLFLRRVKAKRKKLGLEPLKYILVTEYVLNEDDSIKVRPHHHLLMNSMNRDLIESLWKEKRQKLGKPDAQRIDPDLDKLHNGIEGLARYMTKNPKGKKRWSSSRNLKRPVETKNDHKYSRKRVRAAAEDPANGFTYFEGMYPDWEIASINYELNQLTGEWTAYLKMWRRHQSVQQ
jgi:hypothetical protein